MNKLTDELLNKFIDNELDQAALKLVRDQLNDSEEDRKRLLALQRVHRELKKMKEVHLPLDFTDRVMERIVKKSKAKKEQKIFIYSVTFVFAVIMLGITGYLLYYILTAGSAQNSAHQVRNMISTIENFVEPVKNILKGDNISIIGSVFSFGLLVSLYFIFDTLKNSKNNFSNPH